MKKRALIIISALLLAACGGPEKPKKLLGQEEMENIMYDISLLQAIRSFAPQKLAENNIDAHTYIFKKYKTDSLTLAQNQLYYAQDLKTYKKMQDNVSGRLKAELEKLTGKKDKAKAKPGSPVMPKITTGTTPTPPQTTSATTKTSQTLTPGTPERKAALKRRRDSLRDVAQRKLRQAPLNKITRE